MTRGQGGSLLLSCTALSSATPCRLSGAFPKPLFVPGNVRPNGPKVHFQSHTYRSSAQEEILARWAEHRKTQQNRIRGATDLPGLRPSFLGACHPMRASLFWCARHDRQDRRGLVLFQRKCGGGAGGDALGGDLLQGFIQAAIERNAHANVEPAADESQVPAARRLSRQSECTVRSRCTCPARRSRDRVR